MNRTLPSLHEELEIILTVHLRDSHCISLVLLQSGIELLKIYFMQNKSSDILIVHNCQKIQDTNFLFNKILNSQIQIVNNFGLQKPIFSKGAKLILINNSAVLNCNLIFNISLSF